MLKQTLYIKFKRFLSCILEILLQVFLDILKFKSDIGFILHPLHQVIFFHRNINTYVRAC